MRMATFAEAWRRGGQGAATLVGAIEIPFVAERIAASRLARKTDLPSDGRNAVLLIDHYDATVRASCAARSDYQLRVLVDDLGGAVPSGVDVVWNPNAYGDARDYVEFSGPLFAGVDCIPVRADLPAWRDSGEHEIAVSQGGTDASATMRAALPLLRERLSPARLREVVVSSRPWDDIARCARLITGAGITLWEAASVGIPVVVVATVANHERGADWARSVGVPTVNAVAAGDPACLAELLAEALEKAHPLPRVADGSAGVSRALAALADARGRP